jgi:2-iminobutanoate/2-iminopropanoate deaminase
MPKTAVVSPDAPQGAGPYSPALRVGDFVFVSGQASLDPVTHEILGETIEEQTRNTLHCVKALLEAAGATLDDVVKVTTFLAHAEDYPRFAEIYKEFFTNEPLPTCSTVEAAQVWDHLIKLECMAYVGKT